MIATKVAETCHVPSFKVPFHGSSQKSQDPIEAVIQSKLSNCPKLKMRAATADALLLQQLTCCTPLIIQFGGLFSHRAAPIYGNPYMRRLRHLNTERLAARPVWVDTASLLQRARSAPARSASESASALMPLDEGRDAVSREAADLAEQWRRAPPVSQRFGKQAIVQNLLTRQRQRAASSLAVAAASRKRSRTHDDS